MDGVLNEGKTLGIEQPAKTTSTFPFIYDVMHVVEKHPIRFGSFVLVLIWPKYSYILILQQVLEHHDFQRYLD